MNIDIEKRRLLREVNINEAELIKGTRVDDIVREFLWNVYTSKPKPDSVVGFINYKGKPSDITKFIIQTLNKFVLNNRKAFKEGDIHLGVFLNDIVMQLTKDDYIVDSDFFNMNDGYILDEENTKTTYYNMRTLQQLTRKASLKSSALTVVTPKGKIQNEDCFIIKANDGTFYYADAFVKLKLTPFKFINNIVINKQKMLDSNTLKFTPDNTRVLTRDMFIVEQIREVPEEEMDNIVILKKH